jgi:hypothetical protein
LISEGEKGFEGIIANDPEFVSATINLSDPELLREYMNEKVMFS